MPLDGGELEVAVERRAGRDAHRLGGPVFEGVLGRVRRRARGGAMRPPAVSSSIEPYPFAELERKIEEKQREGVDVISLGIGDPDRPTPPHVVEAMASARARSLARTSIPPTAAAPSFREAVASFYQSPVRRRRSTPRPRSCPALGGKECIYHLNFAFLDPGDLALASDPGYPVYTGGPLLAGAEPLLLPLLPERGFAPDLGAIDGDSLERARLMFLNYPNNPTGAVAPDGLLRGGRRASPASTICSSCTTTPTRRSPSTATSRRASSRPRARWTSGSRSSRSRRATT